MRAYTKDFNHWITSLKNVTAHNSAALEIIEIINMQMHKLQREANRNKAWTEYWDMLERKKHGKTK